MASLKETRGETTPEDANAPKKRETAAHAIHESAVSHDKPMERKSPEAPFALVGLAYFAILAVIGLIIGIVLFALS